MMAVTPQAIEKTANRREVSLAKHISSSASRLILSILLVAALPACDTGEHQVASTGASGGGPSSDASASPGTAAAAGQAQEPGGTSEPDVAPLTPAEETAETSESQPQTALSVQPQNRAIGAESTNGEAFVEARDSARVANEPNEAPPARTTRRAADLAAAVRMLADAEPGTKIIVPSGEYSLDKPLELRAAGERQEPVVLAAENDSVEITGRAGFDIVNSNWLVIDGFTMSHSGRTMNVTDSNNVRITRVTFRLSPNPAIERQPDVTTHWLRIRNGRGHRVDHSEFGPHPGGLGVTLLVENAVDSVRIDGNFFHDRPRDGRNGAETIRLGSGGGSPIDALVENNLFERCHGEAELVSVKSDGAVIRNNTFRNNRGQVVVRNGRNVTIAGNYFLGTDPSVESGGIRLHGRNICVAQNYFSGLATPAIQTFPGSFTLPRLERNASAPADSVNTSGYAQTTDVVFAGNTIVPGSNHDGRSGSESRSTAIVDQGIGRKASSDATLQPERWVVSGNLILVSGTATDGHDATGMEAGNNVFQDITDLRQLDAKPTLLNTDGIWQPEGTSRAPQIDYVQALSCEKPDSISVASLEPPLKAESMSVVNRPD